MRMFSTKLFALTNDPNSKVDGQAGADVNLPKVNATFDTIKPVLSILFGVIALVAVIYIIVAGLQFINSQGDTQKVAKARQTILYAVIGLVIALSAEVIVLFVIGSLME